MSTRPVKKKRKTVWVEWDEHEKKWFYMVPSYWNMKDTAVEFAKIHAKKWWQNRKQPVEVIVRTKTGRIGEGRGSRSTFGRDPRRSVG